MPVYNTKTVRRRRRKPEEIAAPRVAIRNFCLECMCYDINEVERCTAPECWLYPWRMGADRNPNKVLAESR